MWDSMIIYMVTLIRRKFVHNRVGSIWAMEYNGGGKGGGVIAADDKVCIARTKKPHIFMFSNSTIRSTHGETDPEQILLTGVHPS